MSIQSIDEQILSYLDLTCENLREGMAWLDALIIYIEENFEEKPDIYWELVTWKNALDGAYLSGPEI